MWTLRAEVLAIVTGGSLFSMAKLLAVFQTMVSFNLRSLRSLYDSFLLSLVVLLLAGEAALTSWFAVFIFAFGVVTLTFLAAANPIGESSGMRRLNSTRMLGLAIAVPGVCRIHPAGYRRDLSCCPPGLPAPGWRAITEQARPHHRPAGSATTGAERGHRAVGRLSSFPQPSQRGAVIGPPLVWSGGRLLCRLRHFGVYR